MKPLTVAELVGWAVRPLGRTHLVRVSLREFAATGNLGPIKAGFTSVGLESVFGEPEATGGTSRHYRQPTIWKYGDIEFAFAHPHGELCLIHLDRFRGVGGSPEGWGELVIEPWVIKEGLSHNTFIAAIEEAGMNYTLRKELQFNQEVVVLASGVEIGFICRPEEYSPPVGLAWLSRRVAAAEPVAAADGGRDSDSSWHCSPARGNRC